MTRNRLLIYFIFVVLFSSCKTTPSHKDIEKKILFEYACAETAKINSLEIVKSSPTTTLFGLKGYEFIVNGEVEWPAGCTEFGTSLPSGYKEKFDNKRVVLVKSEQGWQ